MFVTNHVLSGVVIGRLLERHPVSAFVVGVGSHLVLDMVPHWGCEPAHGCRQELFLRYARRDGLVGLFAWPCPQRQCDRRARTATVAAIAGATCSTPTSRSCTSSGRNPFPAWSSGGSMRGSRTSRRRACPTRSSSE